MSQPIEKCKQSVYFPADMLDEIVAEARRLDRSVSWIVQYAWNVARPRIREMPPPTPVVLP